MQKRKLHIQIITDGQLIYAYTTSLATYYHYESFLLPFKICVMFS